MGTESRLIIQRAKVGQAHPKFCFVEVPWGHLIATQGKVSTRQLGLHVGSSGKSLAKPELSPYLPQRVYPIPRLLWECWAILGKPVVPLVK